MPPLQIYDLSTRDAGAAQIVANMGNSFLAPFMKAREDRRRMEMQEGINEELRGGFTPESLQRAAQRAIAGGDVQTGAALLQTATQARKQAQEQASASAWNQALGLGGTPAASPQAQAMPPAGRGRLGGFTAVAETEDDVRRLEGSVGTPGERVAARLINNGLTPTQAAGITSNLNAESRFNPVARNPGDGRDGSDSIGIAQWNSGRAQALKQYAAATGRDWRDTNTQADFIAQELRTTEAGAASRIAQAQNPQQAALAAISYFRPAGYTAANPMGAHNASGRVGAANQFVVAPSGGGATQMAQADAPATGAQPAQFAVPGGSALPPGDPLPQFSNEQLTQFSTDPGLSDGRRTMAQRTLEGRMQWAREAETRQLQRESLRLQNEERRRKAGERFEPLTTPEARRAAGIPDTDTGPYQINRVTNEVRSVGGNRVTLNNQQEREFDRATGKAVAERFDRLVTDGDQAVTDLQTLGDLRQLGQRIQTGGGAALQGWLAERGVKVGENVGAVEAYGALIDKLTPQQRAPGSGATSDFDARMFKASLPRLINTPGGNEIIVSTLERLADNRIRRADIAQRVQIGELTVKQGIDALRGLQQEARQMSNDLRETPYKGAQQGQAGQGARPVAPTPELMRNAKRAPDGNMYVPDPNRPGGWLKVER